MSRQLIEGKGIIYGWDEIDDTKIEGWRNIDIRIQINERKIDPVNRAMLVKELTKLKLICEALKNE